MTQIRYREDTDKDRFLINSIMLLNSPIVSSSEVENHVLHLDCARFDKIIVHLLKNPFLSTFENPFNPRSIFAQCCYKETVI
ncbi:hypothetical protein BJQ96_02749 [Flavobacterium sp. PL0002]|nr:hypothetical protein [Flavobacterium sp. PL002]